jgi:hypothetical protein
VGDAVETQIWLPTTTWNGRMVGVGGGGYIAGLYDYMFDAMDAAIAEGYVTLQCGPDIDADLEGLCVTRTFLQFLTTSLNQQ